jgi:hypothetical protein
LPPGGRPAQRAKEAVVNGPFDMTMAQVGPRVEAGTWDALPVRLVWVPALALPPLSR